MSSQRLPGDHFSTVSGAYAAFRPRYPRELFAFVASVAPSRERAWDCGAGSGQATLDLAEHFDEVVATDISAEQIARGPTHPRVRWLVAPAESTPLDTRSVDLVAVAQALHWFDHDRFYAEVRRVSKPGAAIAAWTYGPPTMEGAVGEALNRLMFETLGTYWPPERRYVETEYRTIPFPFERIPSPSLSLRENWTLPRVAGYARSWSASVRYAEANGVDAVYSFLRDSSTEWSDDRPRQIVWPLVLLAGRVD
ncbi:MAG: class I SAM-dependent methyltransferase [Solirubrobacteraceae bacterium]